MVITCTGILLEEKNAIITLVTALGGIYQPHLDMRCNLMIVGKSGTDKYCFAKSEQIPMVTSQWLKDSFIKATPLAYDTYEPGIFLGLVFCVTQVQAGVRSYVYEQSTSHGGHYTPDLRRDHNTHLIAVRKDGRKYEYAKKWNMKIVTPKWFFDCIESKHFLPETNYTVPE